MVTGSSADGSAHIRAATTSTALRVGDRHRHQASESSPAARTCSFWPRSAGSPRRLTWTVSRWPEASPALRRHRQDPRSFIGTSTAPERPRCSARGRGKRRNTWRTDHWVIEVSQVEGRSHVRVSARSLESRCCRSTLSCHPPVRLARPPRAAVTRGRARVQGGQGRVDEGLSVWDVAEVDLRLGDQGAPDGSERCCRA
jgi:hypothetical protein